MTNIKRLHSGIDVRPLKEALLAKPELWGEIIARQATPGSPHADTESIILRWAHDTSLDAVFNMIPAIDYPALKELPMVDEITKHVLQITEATELGRILIASLKPGGRITPHADEGAYADYYERFHIPISSVRYANTFFVEAGGDCGEYADMHDGELWWFNHKCVHTTLNVSDEPRVHLIIDAVAPKYRRERV